MWVHLCRAWVEKQVSQVGAYPLLAVEGGSVFQRGFQRQYLTLVLQHQMGG